uniref:BURP domain-containing protein n=1 Tax=Oryza rufipogon TaxID=4529 RepID=A0A0E0PJ49_ORYRU
MRSTLAECEAAPQAGEAKRCATSLESMVEFAASSLGTRDVHAVAAAGASHAASPAEMYWKIALPTSPMPGAIRDLISPASSVGSASKEDTVGN